MEANNDAESLKKHAIMTILFEILDCLRRTTNEDVTPSSPSTTTANLNDNDVKILLSRLQDVATPMETMNVIAPCIFRNTTDNSPTLNSTDALQILGFLVSSPIDVVVTSQQEQQRPQYLLASSKVIKTELQKYLIPASSLSSVSTDLMVDTESHSDDTLYISNELIHVLVHQACTGLDVEVSQNCHDAILALFQIPKILTTSSIRSLTLEGIVTIWSNAIHSVTNKEKEKKVRSEYGTICVRCTTLIVDIILLNDTRTMEKLFLEIPPTDPSNVGNLLCSLLTDLPDDDPLLQVSIYDVLLQLASERPYHSIRTQWLFQDAFVQPLLRKVGISSSLGDEISEPDLYLGASALRILIAICSMLMDAATRNDADAVTIGDTLIRDLHMALRNFEMNGNEMDRLSYIDAISSLASTSPAAMNMVLDDPITCEAWLRLSVAHPKIKAAILVSIAKVLDHPNALSDGSTKNIPHISNEICMKLYSSLGRVNSNGSGFGTSDTTDVLLKLVQSPIPEIRFGVYSVFESIAKYSMGGQVLMTNTNFYSNFLTQRDTIETTYEGRILKYNIVQALHENSTLRQLLANDIVTQLEQYLSQGPHYRKPLQWEVMTMEQ